MISSGNICFITNNLIVCRNNSDKSNNFYYCKFEYLIDNNKLSIVEQNFIKNNDDNQCIPIESFSWNNESNILMLSQDDGTIFIYEL